MCGITGLFSSGAYSGAMTKSVDLMNRALLHRGPDGSGVWRCQQTGLVLGHVRLSIQDVSALGAQPMHCENNRYTITFNGEIYNFKQLRASLVELGHVFKGGSDTEVLLGAIVEWGLDKALQLSIGMFAFALWDNREMTLHLVRDRLGEKPLYYGVINGQLVFASELKAIYTFARPSEMSLDMDALSTYLRYGYISAPYSIFKELRKLPPASKLSIALNEDQPFSSVQQLEDRVSQYWTSKGKSSSPASIELSDESAIVQLDAVLNEVVKDQAIADVPLGAFLSGGIDSSLVTAVLQANSGSPIKTFTIGFDEKQFNEAEQAKLIATHIGTEHTELYIGEKDVLNALPDMADIYDEPFADSSQIPMYLVSALARSKVTVCLSGDGGDELFGGYNRYIWTDRAFRIVHRLPWPVRIGASSAIKSISPASWDRLALMYSKVTGKKGPAAVGLKAHKFSDVLRASSISLLYRSLSSYWDNPAEVLLHEIREPVLSPPRISQEDFLEDAMAWDKAWYLPGDNLVKTDRASMATSLEMRLPLLDRRVVEFADQTPLNMKIRGRQTKWLLRELLYRYVPKDLVDRPKMGFSMPIANWLRHGLAGWASDLLGRDFIERQNIFDADLLEKIYDQHTSGKCDHSHKLWTILIFQSWYLKHL